MRNHSTNAVELIDQYTDANGMVAVHHVAGISTQWLVDGDRSWPDPDSRTHQLSIPKADLTVRVGDTGTGEFCYLVYPSRCGTFNIVRANNGRLEAGDPKRPVWMY